MTHAVVTVYARIVDSTENTGRSLPELRAEIDEIDAAIVELLARRLDVCRDVAHVKHVPRTVHVHNDVFFRRRPVTAELPDAMAGG